MKVALVISSLGVGGAERVLVNMANYWAERGEEVILVSFGSPDAPKFHVLHDRIRLLSLNLLAGSSDPIKAIRQNLARVKTIKRTLREIGPDVIISFMDRTNTLTLFAARRLGIPVIVSDRVDPGCPNIGRTWNTLRSLSYRHAASLVLQMGRFKAFYGPAMQTRIVEIPNPISKLVRTHEAGSFGGREDVVLSMGRLVDVKSFDKLIDAFALVAEKHPGWRLCIYGQGPEKDVLQGQIAGKGLAERIELMGVTDEALAKMSTASIFALASVSEGIPNVLIEAMAMGCAVVSTDVGGVPEVVTNDQDGLIVPMNDVGAMSRALDLLMSDASIRLRLGQKALSVRDRYAEDRIMGAWDNLVRSVIAGFRATRR